jgi:hypothetical protein
LLVYVAKAISGGMIINNNITKVYAIFNGCSKEVCFAPFENFLWAMLQDFMKSYRKSIILDYSMGIFEKMKGSSIQKWRYGYFGITLRIPRGWKKR